MKCPKCERMSLRVSKIEDGLLAANCQKCDGKLIPLFYYRDWAEKNCVGPVFSKDITFSDAADTKPTDETEPTNDTRSAIVCPKCGKLMTKYKMDSKVKNHLDVCHSCDEAWLDGGEWELLKKLNLSFSLPKVFTDSWQRQINKEVCADKRRSVLEKTIGEATIVEVDAFKEILDAQKFKEDILVYLASD